MFPIRLRSVCHSTLPGSATGTRRNAIQLRKVEKKKVIGNGLAESQDVQSATAPDSEIRWERAVASPGETRPLPISDLWNLTLET